MNTGSPIFIVGMPRSGTTMLRSILNKHPRIAISYETHFINFWMQEHRDIDISDKKQFERFWNKFAASDRFLSLQISKDLVFARIRKYPSINWKIIFDCLMKEYANKIGKERCGEKTPAHYAFLDVLFEWYPDCRVIWMVRDPRAVAASYLQTPWSNGSIIGPARRWKSSIQFLIKREKDKRILILKYEDLVNEKVNYLEKVFNFIDEKFEFNSKNDFHETIKDVHPGGEWAQEHFSNAGKPINEHSLNKWRSNLSKKQIKQIEHITRYGMKKFNYYPEYKNKTLIEIFIIDIAQISFFLNFAINRPANFYKLLCKKVGLQSNK